MYITEVDQSTGVVVIKSGSDFEQFSDFDLFFDCTEAEHIKVAKQETQLVKYLYSPQKNFSIRVENVPITNRIAKNAMMEEHIEVNTAQLREKMSQVVGYFDVDIESRFEKLRYEETNCCNFFCDLMRTRYPDCDLALLPGGAIRTNAEIPRGEVTLRVINEILPFPDKIVLVRIPGDALKQLLENSVS